MMNRYKHISWYTRRWKNTINKEIHLIIDWKLIKCWSVILKGKTEILRKCIKIQAELYLEHRNPDMNKENCIKFIKDILEK